MKHLIAILFLIPTLAFGAYTEFYIQSGGGNLNACSTTNNTAAYTSVNGNWNTTTRVFTPTDGSTPASTVAVGDWGSVYLDAATVGVYISRITAVGAGVNGTITFDATAIMGTAPTTSATGRSVKVGGACKGPSGATAWPFSVSTLANLKNAAGDPPRINIKNDTTYNITTGVNTVGGPLIVQGYTSTVGDGGRATIDGGSSNILLVTVGNNLTVIDIIAQNNATGSLAAFSVGSGSAMIRCVANNVRGNGFDAGTGNNLFIEDEAYACNKSNTASGAGFKFTSSTSLLNCISHDNTGSNSDGFNVVSDAALVIFSNCIADTNGRHGIAGAMGAAWQIFQSDFYNNSGDGIKNLQTTTTTNNTNIRNCNFIKNTGWGINSSLTTGRWSGLVDNNGFGSGTQVNGSGSTNGTSNLTIAGSVTYTANIAPWVDPANGDFRINFSGANWAGRGAFTQTAASYTGTVGYPDIGAAQSKTGAGGTFSKEVSYGYAY